MNQECLVMALNFLLKIMIARCSMCAFLFSQIYSEGIRDFLRKDVIIKMLMYKCVQTLILAIITEKSDLK